MSPKATLWLSTWCWQRSQLIRWHGTPPLGRNRRGKFTCFPILTVVSDDGCGLVALNDPSDLRCRADHQWHRVDQDSPAATVLIRARHCSRPRSDLPGCHRDATQKPGRKYDERLSGHVRFHQPDQYRCWGSQIGEQARSRHPGGCCVSDVYWTR